jgi:MFS family permease
MRIQAGTYVFDQIGRWSYIVVILVYIFDRTHSTQWLAATGVCRWAPGLLIGSYGGVIADRYQRTTVMIVSALASAVIMTGMAIAVAAGAAVWIILALIVLISVAVLPYRPAAGALIPEIVGEKDLAERSWVRAPMTCLRRARHRVAAPQPPMADMGRSGWRKDGSLMP